MSLLSLRKSQPLAKPTLRSVDDFIEDESMRRGKCAYGKVVGIKEDSATGTSAAATACLLFHHQAVDATQTSDLVFEQGYAIGQPSEIHVRLSVNGQNINEVWVAGRGTTRAKQEFEA